MHASLAAERAQLIIVPTTVKIETRTTTAVTANAAVTHVFTLLFVCHRALYVSESMSTIRSPIFVVPLPVHSRAFRVLAWSYTACVPECGVVAFALASRLVSRRFDQRSWCSLFGAPSSPTALAWVELWASHECGGDHAQPMRFDYYAPHDT